MIFASISLVVGSIHPAVSPVPADLFTGSEDAAHAATSDAEPACPSDYEVPDRYPSSATPNCNPGKWITTSDYPSAAILAGEEGQTSFTLVIDAQGRPTRCRVENSSGSSRLDARVCPLLMHRARFVPAFSEAGEPIESEWSSSIRWEVPAPPPPTEMVTILWPSALLDGSRSHCVVAVPDSRHILPEAFCEREYSIKMDAFEKAGHADQTLYSIEFPANRLPPLEGLPDLGPSDSELLLHVEPDGEISQCQWKADRGPAIEPSKFCRAYQRTVERARMRGNVILKVSYEDPEGAYRDLVRDR